MKLYVNFWGALGSELFWGRPVVCSRPGMGSCEIHCVPSSPTELVCRTPCQCMVVTTFNLLTTSTTTWSPRLTSSVGPGNWPLIRMAFFCTPSGLTVPSSSVSLNLRTAGLSSLCAAAHSGE